MAKIHFITIRTRKKGTNIHQHTHDCFEFVYYFSGLGEINLRDRDFHFDSKSFFLFTPGTLHNEIFYEDSESLVLGFSLSKEELNEGVPLENVTSNTHSPVIFELVNKIREEFLNQYIHYELVIRNAIMELLININRRFREKSNKAILYAVSYLNEYFTKDIKIKELANSSFYSFDHFRKLFKAETGKTPKEYLTEKRLEYAKHLIEQSDLSFEDISKNCGFGYYCQFYQLFKRHVGLTPSEYKLQITGQTTKTADESAEL